MHSNARRRVPTAARAAACAAAAMAATLATCTPSAVAAEPGSPAATAGWQVFNVPVSGQAVLASVTAPGHDDAWAAGFTITHSSAITNSSAQALTGDVSSGRRLLPRVPRATAGSCTDTGSLDSLMLRWDGTQWQRASVPDLGRINHLSSTGTADAWAAADCGILHWDGSSWSSVTFPEPSSTLQPAPVDIAADRPDDAWLTGSTYDSSANRLGGFVDHWDGQTWQSVTLPSLSTDYYLDAVTAQAPDDVWIAGTDYSGNDATPASPERLILLHWDGRSWAQLPAPATGMWTQRVTGLSGTSADDIWMTGWGKVAPDGAEDRLPLVLHWDGSQWSDTTVPAGRGELSGAASADGSVWAGGDTYSPTATTWGMEMLRWDGTQWVTAQAPEQGNDGSVTAVAARPGGGLWAVGSSGLADNPAVAPVIALQGGA